MFRKCRGSDHAQYLAHWLIILKADKRTISAAASKAAEACAYLRGQPAWANTTPSGHRHLTANGGLQRFACSVVPVL